MGFVRHTAVVVGVAGPPLHCLSRCRRTLLGCASTAWATTTSRRTARTRRAVVPAAARAMGRATVPGAWAPWLAPSGDVRLLLSLGAAGPSADGSPWTAGARPAATRSRLALGPRAVLRRSPAAARRPVPRRQRWSSSLSLMMWQPLATGWWWWRANVNPCIQRRIRFRVVMVWRRSACRVIRVFRFGAGITSVALLRSIARRSSSLSSPAPMRSRLPRRPFRWPWWP